MPYVLGDRTLPPDSAWEHEGIQYPANWLRQSTADDRGALGIVWVEDGPSWDRRFYNGYDVDGNLIPKDFATLKATWIKKTKQSCNGRLQASDWMVIRAADGGDPVPAEWTTWRQLMRTECQTKIAAIEDTGNVGSMDPYADLGRVQALRNYVLGTDYGAWTPDPNNEPDGE